MPNSPSVAVGVEDSCAEEIGENVNSGSALLVIGETGLENVFYGGRVAGEHVRAAQGAVEGEGSAGGDFDHIGQPLNTAVADGLDG